MTADLEKIKARIRALLAKTVANGCTDGEALAAAEMAARMLREHGLTAEQLEIGRFQRLLGRRRRVLLDDVLPFLAVACRCRVILAEGENLAVRFVGPLPWPEIATWLHETLEGAHRRAKSAFLRSGEYKRRRTTRTRVKARHQFTVGYVQSLQGKLAALAQPDRDAIRHALAVIDCTCAAELRGRKLASLCRPSGAADTSRDRLAGEVAGSQANVAWAVRGGGKASALAGPEPCEAGR